MRGIDRLLLLAALMLPGTPAGAATISETTDTLLITGTVRATYAQKLRAPRLDSWRMQIQWMAPEGSLVKAGDEVVRMDSANLSSEIDQLELQLRGAEQRAQKELAELEVALIEAERARVEADAARAKAAIDAGVPAAHLPKIQFERYQLDLERADNALLEASARRDTAQSGIGKRQAELALERQTLGLDLERKREQLISASLRAERSGSVLYASDPQTGNKLNVGANVQFSTLVAEVTEAADLVVVAWLNEVDGLRLAPDAAVRLTLDAQPDTPFAGQIRRRSGAAEAREAWGASRYFELEIAIQPPADLVLTPGMSVLVEAPASAAETRP